MLNMRLLHYIAISSIVFLPSYSVADVDTSASAPTPDTKPAKKPEWTLTGSLRVREELWDWFGTNTGKGHYNFTGEQLKLGALRTTSALDTMIEIQQTGLFNLPKGSTLAAPQGQLGLGASYFDASGNQQFGIALKQAFVKIKDPKNGANFLKGGRFEFVDGTETVPVDPSLAYLKRERIAHRLIGNFGFTHVGRSFDGLNYSAGKSSNFTLFAGVPTEGVFDQKANDEVNGVHVAYGALTATGGTKSSPSDARLFGAFYEDTRTGVTKVDNRPAPARSADKAGVRIETVGGHYLREFPVGKANVDTLLWGAYQMGSWGLQSHEAYAYAAEVGYQLPKLAWKPWLRVGYYEASGDGNASDSKHGTFFPMLPTPRIYARFPFYSESNLKDAFVQLILKPTAKLSTRLDVHKLVLANSSDLWYGGGGAFQDKPNFGYAGRPSGGFGSLATLVDLSLDYQLRKSTTLTLYVAYADGGNVVQNSFPGKSATYTYLEVTHKW